MILVGFSDPTRPHKTKFQIRPDPQQWSYGTTVPGRHCCDRNPVSGAPPLWRDRRRRRQRWSKSANIPPADSAADPPPNAGSTSAFRRRRRQYLASDWSSPAAAEWSLENRRQGEARSASMCQLWAVCCSYGLIAPVVQKLRATTTMIEVQYATTKGRTTTILTKRKKVLLLQLDSCVVLSPGYCC